MSKFIGGISDGAEVPEVLWILDEINVVQKTEDGEVLYNYVVQDDKNWHLKGTEYVQE